MCCDLALRDIKCLKNCPNIPPMIALFNGMARTKYTLSTYK